MDKCKTYQSYKVDFDIINNEFLCSFLSNKEDESGVLVIQTGFVDIHTHILPNVDDGAQDLNEALDMVRLAWENGTHTIVLTPHYRGTFKKNTPEELRNAFDKFAHAVHEDLPEMQLVLGQEAHYQTELSERIEHGRVLTMADSEYVLLEFRSNALRTEVIRGTMDLIRSGYTPIIAHVERYQAFCKDFSLVDEVLSHGALIQLNADSVMGAHGFWIKHFCAKVLKQGKAHFIASDAHDTKMRTPVLEKCFSYVTRKYGEEYAERLFYRNAHIVIDRK